MAGEDRLLDLLLLLGDERVSRGLEKMLRLIAVLEEKGVLDSLLHLAEDGAGDAILRILLEGGVAEEVLKAPALRRSVEGGL